jgi:hypothetical protein
MELNELNKLKRNTVIKLLEISKKLNLKLIKISEVLGGGFPEIFDEELTMMDKLICNMCDKEYDNDFIADTIFGYENNCISLEETLEVLFESDKNSI